LCASSSASAIGLLHRQRPFQRLARHVLQHQERHALGLLEPVNRRDIGMIQRRQQLGFALESRQALGGVAGQLIRQHLDRHDVLQPRVHGAVDHSHGVRDIKVNAAGQGGASSLACEPAFSRLGAGESSGAGSRQNCRLAGRTAGPTSA